ncbi:MAG: hypothetical protein KDA87_24870 [Planctomycetales bacterium]|nr:hypothetical protein [Planctomycetales bacterium]
MDNLFPAPPSGIQLEFVWPNPAAQVQADVVKFWLAEGALTDVSQAEKRAAELLVVARSQTGEIAAVSTARRVLVPVLNRKCFYYRTYVGKSFRVTGLGRNQLVWSVLTLSYAHLNRRFQEGFDAEFAGLYLEVESESIKRNRNELVWSDMGMNVVYIGTTPQGHHARVWYFTGSCVNPNRRIQRD